MNFYPFYKYFLYLFSAETAHNIAVKFLAKNIFKPAPVFFDQSLENVIAGIHFNNPVGLGAGFDKNATCLNALRKQNFGFLEAGTVTPQPQNGNDKPRLFRLRKNRAIINRMGFNNVGKVKFLENFLKYKENYNIPVGINIGKNKETESATADYLDLLDYFYNHPDYITINISSPNTPNLREIQKNLDGFIKEITKKTKGLEKKHEKTPIFLKIAPDVNDDLLEDICKICLKYKIDALIISNTTLERPEYLREKYKRESGGLSGKPLFELSNQKIAKAYKILGYKIPIIGVGGIENAEDAYEKIKCGASLVQIYSSLIYTGLANVTKINKDLVKLLHDDDYHNISEAVGTLN
jgi:dihydroorotate dehydrogenase